VPLRSIPFSGQNTPFDNTKGVIADIGLGNRDLEYPENVNGYFEYVHFQN